MLRKEQKEYNFGKTGWKLMHWEGEFPDEGECVQSTDPDFLRVFLLTRPKMARGSVGSLPGSVVGTSFFSSMFEDPVRKEEGWIYHARKFSSKEGNEIQAKTVKWQKGFHGTRWACVYSILTNGLSEALDMKLGHRGVYHFETLQRGRFYHRYQLFNDGCGYCIVLVILADPNKTTHPGQQQQVTPPEHIYITGVLTRGYTFHNFKAAMETSDQLRGITVCSQWQPEWEFPLLRI